MSKQNHNSRLSYLEYQDCDFLDYLSLFRGKSASVVDHDQLDYSDVIPTNMKFKVSEIA